MDYTALRLRDMQPTIGTVLATYELAAIRSLLFLARSPFKLLNYILETDRWTWFGKMLYGILCLFWAGLSWGTCEVLATGHSTVFVTTLLVWSVPILLYVFPTTYMDLVDNY